MLVLARKKGQSIMIGEGIEITVLSVEGDAVKLGIQAPKNVDIHRKEVYVAIQQSNQSALLHHTDLQDLAGFVRKKMKK